MKSTDRSILAAVALSYCQEVMAARIHLLVHWMLRKLLKQFCSMYFNGIPNVPLLQSKVHLGFFSH